MMLARLSATVQPQHTRRIVVDTRRFDGHSDRRVHDGRTSLVFDTRRSSFARVDDGVETRSCCLPAFFFLTMCYPFWLLFVILRNPSTPVPMIASCNQFVVCSDNCFLVISHGICLVNIGWTPRNAIVARAGLHTFFNQLSVTRAKDGPSDTTEDAHGDYPFCPERGCLKLSRVSFLMRGARRVASLGFTYNG